MTVKLSQSWEKLPDVIGIVGSRGPDPIRGRPTGFTDYPLVHALVLRIITAQRKAGRIATIVSGGAPSGVDYFVNRAARTLGMCFGEHLRIDPTTVNCPKDHFHEIPALWRGASGREPLNRQAGHDRNDKLVRHCGLLIALFGPNATSGTQDAINRAREYEIPVLVYQNGRWHE